MKRFYDKVAVAPTAAGFAVELDGRPIRTPKKAAFAVPGEAVAAAIAEEWRRQGDKIEPEGIKTSCPHKLGRQVRQKYEHIKKVPKWRYPF